MKVGVIINPKSGGGRGVRIWKDAKGFFHDRFKDLSFEFTERAWHATEITKKMLKDGVDRIIVAGGDGTLHEVVNGLFENGQPKFREHFTFGVLSSGRGCDYARSLKMPSDLDQVMPVVAGSKTIKADIGRVDFENGKTLYYINSSSYGLGGQVAKSVQKGGGLIPAPLLYAGATVKNVIGATGKSLSLSIDGQTVYNGKSLNLFTQLGRYLGGGMLWAPNALLNDGLFDIVLVEDRSLPKLLTLTPKIYAGTAIEAEGVKSWTGSRVTISSPTNQLLELDGEVYSASRVDFSILKNQLNVLVP